MIRPSYRYRPGHGNAELVKAAVIFSLIGIVLALVSLYAQRGVAVWSTAPVVTPGRFVDLWVGTPALLVGPLETPAAPGQFAVFVTEYQRCSRDADGDRSCSWYESSRWTPPVRAAGVDVVNSDYLLSGRLFEQYSLFRDARTRGIPPGAVVLVAAQRAPDGAVARELYVGSPDEYRAGWVILLWVSRIGALCCGVLAAGATYLRVWG